MARDPMRRILDAVERVVVLTLNILLIYRFLQSAQLNWMTVVYLVSEGLVVLMLLLRRSTDQISVSARDWLLAFTGTLAALLIYPGRRIDALGPLAALLLLGGIAISVAAKLSLNRSFGIVAANRGVKTGGPYAYVRHPMYLGYFLSQAAFLIMNFSAWNIVVLSIWATSQVLRIHAEEGVLLRDPSYSAHATRVPYRLVPWIY
jgi:protein-S-isoprenylcysteine O-methyltransferase Ste14